MSTGLHELKSKRLRLRRLSLSDWESVSFLRTDDEVNKYVKRPSAETKKKAIEFIKEINQKIDDLEVYYWCICTNTNNQMIGSICLWNFSKDKTQAEVGYDLMPEFQSRGIMSEALFILLEFAFSELNLRQIDAYTSNKNKASLNLLERNGFKIIKGKTDIANIDNVVYSMQNCIS